MKTEQEVVTKNKEQKKKAERELSNKKRRREGDKKNEWSKTKLNNRKEKRK